MKIARLLKAYYIIGILLLLGEGLDISFLRLSGRLLILPLLFFIYLRSAQKVNYVIIAIFVIYFTGGISNFFDQALTLKYTLLVYGAGHILMGALCFQLINEKSTQRLLLYAIPVISLWAVYYDLYLDETFGDTLGSLYPIILGYSIILGLFNILANVSFFNSGSYLTMYLVIISVSLLVGDIMMCLYIFVDSLNLFKVINEATHLVSYLFLLRFALNYSGFKLKSKYLP
ncbi:hypothetical protein [Ascidiimonas aurantiaca]|uniref:hypothetical protein n=1 Tax=Ascidiimonas aurantiaca TaxID=1685432 RepID=UPI0030EEDC39